VNTITAEKTADIAAFLANLNFLAETHGVFIDSYTEQFFTVNDKATPLCVRWDDEASAYHLVVRVP
jgi:hypothetical protein